MTPQLSVAEGLRLRMHNLQLAEQPGGSAADIVTWFGAMQAQEIGSALWSLGSRTGGDQASLAEDLERLEVVRTWPMRGTVHWVPTVHARWMLELTGAIPLRGAARRAESHGITLADADRATAALGDALKGTRLTRAECLEVLTDVGLPVTAALGYFLLWYASQMGEICIAPQRDGAQTFVRLDEAAPNPNRPDRQAALGILAERYFRSHGPTTLKDFAGWTGLNQGDCRVGIEAAAGKVVEVEVAGATMYTAPFDDIPDFDGTTATAAFDEYLLGYKDRSWMLHEDHYDAVIPGNNGIFRPALSVAGRVVGTWRKTATRKSGVTVTIQQLGRISKRDQAAAERAISRWADWLGTPATFQWSN